MVDGHPDKFRMIVLDARRRFLLCFFIFFYVYGRNALPHSSRAFAMIISPSLYYNCRLMFRQNACMCSTPLTLPCFPCFFSLYSRMDLSKSCVEPIIYCVEADGRAI